MRAAAKPQFALTKMEYEVLAAMVTKFAADLVLYRLAKPVPTGEAAALEEVATAAAVMLNDRRPAAPVEVLAIQAISESISTGSPDEFFEALATPGILPFSPDRLKQVARVIHGKLTADGFRAAA
jgi:hypothetical protein